jgi:hypothetical protein
MLTVVTFLNGPRDSRSWRCCHSPCFAQHAFAQYNAARVEARSMKGHGIRTHISVDNPAHLVEVDGNTLLLFHCISCDREFARERLMSAHSG